MSTLVTTNLQHPSSGSPNLVLAADGSVSGSSIVAPGLKLLLHTETTSALSEIIVDGVFDNSHENYRIVFWSQQAGASSTVPVYFQWRSGGSSISTSSYGHTLVYNSHAGGPSRAYASAQSSSQVTNVGNAAGYFSIDVMKPHDGGVIKTLTGTYGGFGDSANYSGVVNAYFYGGLNADGFRVYPNSGTFSSSAIVSVYGYRQ